MSVRHIRAIALNLKVFSVPFVSVKKLHGVASSFENFNNSSSVHIPVMVNEVVEILDLKKGNLFLDMTFGCGGHSSVLLEKVPDLHVLALDRDPHTEKYMRELREKYSNNVTPLIGKFSDLPDLLEEKNIRFNSVDGILLDLGCSSMQLDVADRGFSFTHSGPIDMRMDGDRIPNSITAADVIAHATETDLYKIFKIYGEDRLSMKIARAIIQSRYNFQPLTNTKELAELIESVHETTCNKSNKNSYRSTHVATKIFQALRIFVNNELNELHYGLMLAYKYLKKNGRVVTLSFHSLEDKIIKAHFKNLINYADNYISPIQSKTLSELHPLFQENKVIEYWSEKSKKGLVSSVEEVILNPRSRSAKLRAATKIN